MLERSFWVLRDLHHWRDTPRLSFLEFAMTALAARRTMLAVAVALLAVIAALLGIVLYFGAGL